MFNFKDKILINVNILCEQIVKEFYNILKDRKIKTLSNFCKTYKQQVRQYGF